MFRERRQNKYNVIVLEPSPIYVKLWEKILKNIPGCSYFITDKVESAKKIISENSCDLVISEVLLTDSDGYQIADLTHSKNPDSEVVLTTAYDCDLSRFDLKNPKFSILYKPYSNIDDIEAFIVHLLNHEDVFDEVSEDSFSENDVYPEVLEWKL